MFYVTIHYIDGRGPQRSEWVTFTLALRQFNKVVENITDPEGYISIPKIAYVTLDQEYSDLPVAQFHGAEQ